MQVHPLKRVLAFVYRVLGLKRVLEPAPAQGPYRTAPKLKPVLEPLDGPYDADLECAFRDGGCGIGPSMCPPCYVRYERAKEAIANLEIKGVLVRSIPQPKPGKLRS